MRTLAKQPTPKPTPVPKYLNFRETPNKYGLDQTPVALVIHATLGAAHGAIDWLCTTPEERERKTGVKSYSSAHSVIDRVGNVTELADIAHGTWHAGRVAKPTQRALDVLPKKRFGGLKNPNKSTIGIEFACGYDVDRDGTVEGWEKNYTPQQITACARYIIEWIEPEIERYYGERVEFGNHNIITHRDIKAGKPDLSIQRAMLVAELDKQRRTLGNKEKKVASVNKRGIHTFSTQQLLAEAMGRKNFFPTLIKQLRKK